MTASSWLAVTEDITDSQNDLPNGWWEIISSPKIKSSVVLRPATLSGKT